MYWTEQSGRMIFKAIQAIPDYGYSPRRRRSVEEHRNAARCILSTRTNSIHNITTRQTDKFHDNFCKLQITSKVIRRRGVLLWKNLPDDIRQQVTLSSFKLKLKLHLFCIVLTFAICTAIF